MDMALTEFGIVGCKVLAAWLVVKRTEYGLVCCKVVRLLPDRRLCVWDAAVGLY